MARAIKQVQHILADYVKTGLTVERARELGKADQEGRIVIKPRRSGKSIGGK